MLCATLKDDSIEEIQRASKQADLIEFRLDLFESLRLGFLREQCSIPVIFKLNSADFSKLSLLPDYVDLPHTTSADLFKQIGERFGTIKRICSYHDFEKTGDLETLFAELRTKPAEIYKITTMARSTSDALRMLLFVKKTGCLGICMGDHGVITRILAPVVGSRWSYAPLSEKMRTASGQILLPELKEIYNFKSLNSSTALYGLIGDPVSKSQSHHKHNRAFKEMGLNAVYVKMQVLEKELQEILGFCRELGFKGLSVTMPLKEKVGQYLDECREPAINTIGFQKPKSYGWNTDGVAALNAIEARSAVEGKKIGLIGSGGAAWGIALEAKKRGAHLLIANRSYERARSLAQEVGGEAFALSDFKEISLRGYDILINCSSVGMLGNEGIPVDSSLLLEKKIVMDIINNPRMTPLLEAAQKKGCEVIDGMEMWTLQAKLQYYYWGITSEILEGSPL